MSLLSISLIIVHSFCFFIYIFKYLLTYFLYLFFFTCASRYECSLLRNLQKKIPVFPVFLAEISLQGSNERTFELCNTKMDFPGEPHARGPAAQAMIAKLRYDSV
jgi:hypothetical protein